MAVTIKGAVSPYSKHLGAPEAVKSKVVTGTVQVANAQTQVPVHKAVIDGGCKVGCSGGRTINLGDFNSVKIAVWLEMPCSKDSIAETFDYVSDWVGEQLDQATKSIGGK